MIRYDITESETAAKAVEDISARLLAKGSIQSHEIPLQLVSMRQYFDLKLLTQFYDDLMIPNFPLEEERDDLDDWIYCLDPAKNIIEEHGAPQLYPTMDVLLVVKREEDDQKAQKNNDNTSTGRTSFIIVAGVAFEYYRNAQCGLLSYVVVKEEYRRLGIMDCLHPVACQAMQMLHQENISSLVSSTNVNSSVNTRRPIKAIFAEVNTVEAGDAPPALIRKRHETLHRLGYRHLKFPYIQPALSEDAESFDEIMLLIYSPTDDSRATIQTATVYDFVVDFFQSVTGYDNYSFRDNWYYKLVKWFRVNNPKTEIMQGLPWEDITQEMKECMTNSMSNDTPAEKDDTISNAFGDSESVCSKEEKPNHVVVIGAGIAGLISTVKLAEEYLEEKQYDDNSMEDVDSRSLVAPLTITLIEARPFVGGRIRTVITEKEIERDEIVNCETKETPLLFSNDQLPKSKKVDCFAPWSVPIGAEFVHGVDSMANQLIEDHEEWTVHETFDLCASLEEYPSNNSFVKRRSSLSLSSEQRSAPHIYVVLDGQCCPLHEPRDLIDRRTSNSGAKQCHFQKLIRQANNIWQTLQSISEEFDSAGAIDVNNKYKRDMSLDEFIEHYLSQKEVIPSTEDIITVKDILESLYSHTAGSSNKFLGIHEASREEWSWEYTESNFRLEYCFNEFISYYIDRIAEINKRGESLKSGIRINIKVGCPVTDIGSALNNQSEEGGNVPVRVLTRTGEVFVCDKCIVTVPLGVLKAKNISFRDAYEIPNDMQLAIDTINMFSGIKAHMLLNVGIDIKCISKLMRNTELLFCPGEIFSQIWLRRNETSVFLTGFCVANCRDRLMEMVAAKDERSKSEIAKDLMLAQVNHIFGSSNDEGSVFLEPSSPTCSSFVLHDWSEDEFTLGIYSSPSVGAGYVCNARTRRPGESAPVLTHRDYLATPIKNTIWFAGEHANTNTCATVQSAMESGAKAAKEVYKSLICTSQCS